ncbi:MAG: PIN domain-containing protein [Myxococcaceae bacterium]|nr:PIN domain-containing protein [Myxococcaceae bacterium]
MFVDTNVLVYAEDEDAGVKRERARKRLTDLIRRGDAVLSTQVLQEFFAIAVRKLGLQSEEARARIELLARLEVVVIRPPLIMAAIDLHRLRKLSFWDALIVKTAAEAGCTRLLSEDLSHGQVLEGVRIENPFL